MKKDFATDAKIGLFVVIALLVIAYITIDVSNLTLTPGRTRTIHTILPSAEGISKKTPVQVAGIPVGVVTSIALLDNRTAQIGMKVKRDVQITEDMEVQIRSRGVLGDVYIELIPGSIDSPILGRGGYLEQVQRPGDYQDLIRNASDITKDLKDITAALKDYTEADKGKVTMILNNMEVLTANMASFSSQNAQNMNAIVQNLAALTADLKHLSATGGPEIEAALKRISALTESVEKGEGTIGRLLKDDETVERANKVLANLEDITSTYFSMQTELGYHIEAGGGGNVRNYAEFRLKPRPDKFFLFGVVHDNNPPASTSDSVETFDTDGTVTVVAREKTTFDKIRFNAQLGKTFNDFTIRGGVIESKGGLGMDYAKGPVIIKTDIFDFGGSNVRIKSFAELNVTNSFYLLGGVDDISSRVDGPNWFMGLGVRLTDSDINSLFGGAAIAASP